MASIRKIFKLSFMVLMPLMIIVLVCALHGKTILDLYLPCSLWNDEMMYYKLTEGVLKYGIPQGFFGYNESKALCLSFASWSPVLLIPWVAWGKIFGWTVIAPIICNVVMIGVTFGIITISLRPKWGQLLLFLGGIISCYQFTRYLISCMPETTCWSIVLIIFTIYIYDTRKPSDKLLVLSLVLISILVLMRPYHVLLYFYPVYMLIKRNRKRTIAIILCIIITIGLYYFISHYLSAPYFATLYGANLSKAAEKGLLSGVWTIISELVNSFSKAIKLCYNSIISGNVAGGIYLYTFILTIIQLAYFIREIRKHDNQNKVILDLQLAIAMIGLVFAILLMYDVPVGARHLLAYTFAAVLVLTMTHLDQMNRNTVVSYILLMAFVAFVFYFKGRNDGFYNELPFKTSEFSTELEQLKEQLSENIIIDQDHSSSYSNTMIWVFSDNVNGVDTRVEFGQFYAIPEGMGLDLCYGQYVLDNIDDIQSRYIGTVPGGDIDILIRGLGKKVIAQNKYLVVYQMY